MAFWRLCSRWTIWRRVRSLDYNTIPEHATRQDLQVYKIIHYSTYNWISLLLKRIKFSRVIIENYLTGECDRQRGSHITSPLNEAQKILLDRQQAKSAHLWFTSFLSTAIPFRKSVFGGMCLVYGAPNFLKLSKLWEPEPALVCSAAARHL